MPGESLSFQEENSTEETEKIPRSEFAVAIFGTGEPENKHQEEALKISEELGQTLAANGFPIKTGGYGGAMEAGIIGASEVAQLRGDSPQDYIQSHVYKNLPPSETVQENANITEHTTSAGRLEHLINRTGAYIVLSGGIGTLIELMASQQAEEINAKLAKQNNESRIAHPIIIIDSSKDFDKLVAKAADKYPKIGSSKILNDIFHLGTGNAAEDALIVIESYYKKANQETLNEEEEKFLQQHCFERILRLIKKQRELTPSPNKQESFISGSGI